MGGAPSSGDALIRLPSDPRSSPRHGPSSHQQRCCNWVNSFQILAFSVSSPQFVYNCLPGWLAGDFYFLPQPPSSVKVCDVNFVMVIDSSADGLTLPLLVRDPGLHGNRLLLVSLPATVASRT